MTRIMLPAERHEYPRCRAALGQRQDRRLCVGMTLNWTLHGFKTVHHFIESFPKTEAF